MIDYTLKNANILIIDDQEANIDVLVGLLENQGYTNIITTTDPRIALGLYKSFKPDLILLDLMMPQLSGYEVMKELRDENGSDSKFLPILVLTADITPEAKKAALTAGAKDFLSKPFNLVEVALRIKNLLETSYLYQVLENWNQILKEKIVTLLQGVDGWYAEREMQENQKKELEEKEKEEFERKEKESKVKNKIIKKAKNKIAKVKVKAQTKIEIQSKLEKEKAKAKIDKAIEKIKIEKALAKEKAKEKIMVKVAKEKAKSKITKEKAKAKIEKVKSKIAAEQSKSGKSKRNRE